MNCMFLLKKLAKTSYAESLALIAVFLIFLPLTTNAQLNIGAGASVDAGSGTINMNCSDVNVTGVMNIGSGQLQKATDISIVPGALLQGDNGVINYSGDWRNTGSFQAGHSSVNLTDDCNTGTSHIVGDSDFYRFLRELSVAAGSEQGFLGGLQLVGTGQGRINLHSSVNDSPAFFVLGDNATQQIANVDVRDNDASRGAHIAPVEPASIGSTRGANVVNWFLDYLAPLVPIPTLSAWSLLVLTFCIFAVGIGNARRRELIKRHR